MGGVFGSPTVQPDDPPSSLRETEPTSSASRDRSPISADGTSPRHLEPSHQPRRPSKKATVDELKDGLEKLGLDSKGRKDTLWRRLRGAWTVTTPSSAAHPIEPEEADGADEQDVEPRWRSFLCFDVEATCRAGKEFDYPNEIIEFPVILCRWIPTPHPTPSEPGPSNPKRKWKLEKVDTFHSFVRPTWQPKLTEFCTSLTGITQETVDGAPTFVEVMEKFELWLDKHHLRQGEGLEDTLWVTDGPWDLRDFVPKQIHITPLSPARFPEYFVGPYLNIKQAVNTVLSETWRREQYALAHPDQAPNARALSKITTAGSTKRAGAKQPYIGPNFMLTITGQVKAMGLGDFDGRQHSGLCDATNVARVLIALSERNVDLEPNGTLHKGKRWYWMGEPGEINFDFGEKRSAEPIKANPPIAAAETKEEVRAGAGDIPLVLEAAGVVAPTIGDGSIRRVGDEVAEGAMSGKGISGQTKCLHSEGGPSPPRQPSDV